MVGRVVPHLTNLLSLSWTCYHRVQIVAALQPTMIDVVDNSIGHQCDNGAKLVVTVVTDAFEGVPVLKRHRQINDLLKDEMSHIHALSLNTWTVAQYESKK
jgi:BolA family transcriptional regulator, general stress-responsive regulator